MEYKDEPRELDLMQYWVVILKRKWVLITFASVIVILTGIFSFTTTPIYRASTTILIEESSSKMLSIEDEFGYTRQVSDMRFFNTQLHFLQSLALAERVAEKMKLLSRTEFKGESKKSILGDIKYFVTLRWVFSGNDSEEEKTNNISRSSPYSGIAGSIVNNLDVSPIRDTNLVGVNFTSPYPAFTAELVNTLADEFISFSYETRAEYTRRASDILTTTISNLRDELDVINRELQQYGSEKDLPVLSNTNNPAITTYQAYNAAYTQAELEMVDAQTKYNSLRDATPETLPTDLANPIIQGLQADYTQYRREYEELLENYEEGHPKMRQPKTRLDFAQRQLREEWEKAVEAAKANYESARDKAYSLKRLRNEQGDKVAEMGSDVSQIAILQSQVDSITTKIEQYVKMRDEARVTATLEGMRSSNISVVQKAEIPKMPISPQKQKNLILALMIGLFGGVGLCFFLEYLDNSVKTPDDIEKISGLPSLGMIPYLPPEGISKKKKYGYFSKYADHYSYGDENPGNEEILEQVKEIELVNYLFPRFFISEDYRTVRTSILLSYAKSPPKSIVLSSAVPSEGKTTTASNLAVAFAQLSEKVLIVDSDLRKPRLHKIFKVKNIGGLSGYLAGKATLTDSIKMTAIDNIWILPSGPIPPNPSELLNSERMKELMEKMREGFDMVLFDTPPVLAAIDAVVLSSMVESVLLVLHSGKTTNKAFAKAVDDLHKVKANIMGVVLNEVRMNQMDTYYYKGYHGKYAGY